MLKNLLKRVLQIRLVTCLFSILCLIVIVRFFTTYGQYNYPHIPQDEIPYELHRETSPFLVKKSKLPCKYDEILTSTKSLNAWDIPQKFDDFLPTGIINGSYVPQHCHPAFSVAILVTYRNRQKQLDIFLPYMHNFLRKQNIHYKIYLIEQVDDSAWDKGLLYNIGARRAIAEGFPCLVLHDVDMLPLDDSNLYVCTRQPRHLSGSLDKFRFVLLYDFLIGGVMAIKSEQYTAVDGFSNRFLGWGGEDDDFSTRIYSYGLTIQRFPRTMSRYSMLPHPPEPRNEERLRIMAENRRERAASLPRDNDGLSNIWYDTMEMKHHRLFTWIRVRLSPRVVL